jgi:hypothetical protein
MSIKTILLKIYMVINKNFKESVIWSGLKKIYPIGTVHDYILEN